MTLLLLWSTQQPSPPATTVIGLRAAVQRANVKQATVTKRNPIQT